MNWDAVKFLLAALIFIAIPVVFFEPGALLIPRLFTLIMIFASITVALNIAFGHTDQLFLFNGAMAVTGAYTTILLAMWLGVSMWATILIGGLVAGLIGIIVTYVAAIRELTIIVISILTLALQFAIIELVNHFREYTGGEVGIPLHRVPADLSIEPLAELPWFTDQIVLYYTVAAFLLALMALYWFIMNSRYGLAFEMIRQDADAAKSLGVNVVKYKVIAGFIATFAIGLIGPFIAQLAGFVNFESYTFLHVDVLVLIMLIIGGLRTMYGPVVGAGAVIFINEELRQFTQYRAMLFGILLIILFLYFRQGIVPFVTQTIEKYRIWERAQDLYAGARS